MISFARIFVTCVPNLTDSIVKLTSLTLVYEANKLITLKKLSFYFN